MHACIQLLYYLTHNSALNSHHSSISKPAKGLKIKEEIEFDQTIMTIITIMTIMKIITKAVFIPRVEER